MSDATPAPGPAAPRPAAPRPGAPRPGAPRPGAPRPGAPLTGAIPGGANPGAARPEAAPITPPVDAAAGAAAAKFGRVDDEGNVFVREGDGERAVGQFPGVPAEQALELYIRRFLDLQAKVGLFEARLTSSELSIKEIDQTLNKLSEELAEPAAVGDLAGLRERLEGLKERAKARRGELEAERVAAKAAALEQRTTIVLAAEELAAADPARVQWRSAGDTLKNLLDQWKEAQRTGPRLDRANEDALWKRFSAARTAFDRERRQYFAALEDRNTSAKTAKEKLVARAEALSNQTDWANTAAAYRDLMTEWKAAGRASRKDDDALWARFRAAQDKFFAAREAANQATDAEYEANLVVKEELLKQAEALLPITDAGRAKAALRDIQDKWEAAGKVPRAAMSRVENRLRAVETAIREAEEAKWRRSNPETRARAEGAAAQLHAAIAAAESKLSAAEAAGDKRKVKALSDEIAAKRTWLEQVEKAAADSGH